MPMHPKISVIMPVYNVEKYVGRAIESVLNQTFGDFELLVVDDGSTDGSGRVCDRYASRDARVQVFHQQNSGAPAARNFAMDRARGDYLCFMDADDWVEPQMMERMHGFACEGDLELVVAGFYIDTYCDDAASDCFRQTLSVETQVYPSQRAFREDAYRLFDRNLLYTPWNKLYLRSYVEERSLRFPQTFWDDFPFVLSVIRDVERVGVMQDAFYHFIRARAESETSRYREGMYDKREEEHSWMLDLYRHWDVSDERSLEVVYRRYAERLIGCIENVVCPNCTLPPSEKRAAVGRMIGTPQAKEAVAKTRPRSAMMRVMLWPVKAGLPWVAYTEGRFISFVKRHSTKVFSYLKARR